MSRRSRRSAIRCISECAECRTGRTIVSPSRSLPALPSRVFFLRLLLGLGIDESYTIAISRRLSLSYFDHPPLHLWIAHFAARAAGENVVARVPFVALFARDRLDRLSVREPAVRAPAGADRAVRSQRHALLLRFRRKLDRPRWPAAFRAHRSRPRRRRACSFRQPPDAPSAWRSWLLIGVGLGLAGLSKYSAVLTAGGLAAFVMISRKERHWLKHPAPYVSACVALAMITPVIWWNARNGWASFAFQGSRGVPDGLHPAQFLTMALGEAVFLSPWIFVAAGRRPRERVPPPRG